MVRLAGLAWRRGSTFLAIVVFPVTIATSAVAQNPADVSFDTLLTFGLGQPNGAFGDGLAVQSNGQVVACGGTLAGDNGYVVRLQSDGSLDPTFGTAGVVTTGAGAIADDLVVEGDGKIVVTSGAATLSLLRYQTDGSPDLTFGTGGVVGTSLSYPLGITLQSDGKIVVPGYFGVARFQADGTVDAAFGTNGVVSVLNGGVSQVVIQGDAKLLAVVPGRGLVRLNADGTPDASFGLGGLLPSTTWVSAAALDVTGRIIAAGTIDNTEMGGTLVVQRFATDGTLEVTFATNADPIQVNLLTQRWIAHVVLPQSDGRVVVAGASSNDPFDNAWEVVRFRTDGSIDSSWGNLIPGEGFAGYNGGSGANSPLAGAILPDGRIVLVGPAIFCGNPCQWRFGVLGIVNDVCGDGRLQPGEQCDDGNLVNGDGCDANCTLPACGNGIVDPGEACDDGNLTAGDGCDGTCQTESGWSCIANDPNSPSVCTPICGDGLILGKETCDDGNTTNGDGCSSTCQTEPGWTCTGQPSTCTPICGDGLVVGNEPCDDGANNGTPGDCCSLTCTALATHTPCPDDGNFCTSDYCNGAGQCIHPYEPAAVCALPLTAGGSLKVIAALEPKRDQIQFAWKHGPVVQTSDFGNPSTANPVYELCIYDGVLGGIYHGQPMGPCGTKPCWKQTATAWDFKSATGAPDGIIGVKLIGNALAGKAQVQAKAKGNFLAAGLQLTTPVVAQVRTSDGHCWGAQFSTPLKDVPGQFQAKSD
jgi:uncharacterized delta-60 repeat protein